MMSITVIAMGRLKEEYLRGACSEYRKRLSGFFRTDIIELQPERLSESPSANEISRALDAEGKQIVSKIPKNAFVFALCIEGRQLSSEELSEKLDSIALTGKSDIAFIIGSSYGLSDEVKKRADVKLSMSRMTFPHQLARVMLLEQLYRAGQISGGGKYHK